MDSHDQTCVDAIRFLSVDAVERAGSGHPGLPLGAAPMAFVLWDRFLRHNPRSPTWPNRDRFVLSAGHGSALLYSLLHLTGYGLPLEELERFRQWGSMTPGHPERGETPGVETTTGPLGQGFANGVGMAMAEYFLSHTFNRPGYPILDHLTYAIVSDGDLMEGVASEAASLAGTLGLGKLVYLYDDNHISIEGPTDLAFREDVARRFEAYGWHVSRVEDGNDLEALDRAIQAARDETERPSLVAVRTHIGYGSPKQDSASAHGEPLGEEAVRATKEALGWPLEPAFHIPEEVRTHMRGAIERGKGLENEWIELYERYKKDYPTEASFLSDALKGRMPKGWDAVLPVFTEEDGPLATRQASGKVLNALARRLVNLVGGSADLAPSNKTFLEGQDLLALDGGTGRNVHFGVREHAMQSILNGMALHGGVVPYGGTFLVFSDYMRPALRLAALMGARTITLFTHDSIALGEDGPTHQPVEQVMSLRAIPGLTVLRPADANETAEAFRVALKRDGPVVLALTRQKLPVLDRIPHVPDQGVARGAYVLAEAAKDEPDVLLLATGSEVHLALEAKVRLAAREVEARVVTMPSWELFEEQSPDYRASVLPAGVPRVAIEAGVTLGWARWVGEGGRVIGLDRFGASAPGDVVYRELGFTAERVVECALELVGAAAERTGE